MRILNVLLLLLFLVVAGAPADAQDIEPVDGARIESAELSGFPLNKLSPGLQRDIEALAGSPLERERINGLAQRIEEEHPDVVAAARAVARPEGQARVIFLV